MTQTIDTPRGSATPVTANPIPVPEGASGPRGAAVGGVMFVLLSVTSAFLPGAPPATDASAAKIAAYFRDHAGAVKAQQFIGGLGVIALLWWFGSLWRMMSRAEGERPRLSVVAAASLVAGVTLAMLSGALTAAAAIRIGSIGEGSQLLWTLSMVVISTAGFCISTFLVAVCLLNHRTGIAPAWTNYLGGAAALAFLVGSLGSATDANAVNVFNFVAFLAWSVWIVAVSVSMWRRTPARV